MKQIEILYEDNHLLVVNKPAGLLTQPTSSNQESLETIAKQWIKEKYQKPGAVFLHALHRLDKSVSGIVLFARTSKALTRLNESMRNQNCSKVYLAIVEGELTVQEGILEHYLVHDDFQARIVPANDPKGKKARLRYLFIKKVIVKENIFSLIEIHLETGRYHQIRAQFSSIGHPIVGDRKYGSHQPFLEEAIALHHFRLTIAHPITNQMVSFEAPLPDSFQKQFIQQ